MTASVPENPLHAAFYADRASQVSTAIVENVKLRATRFGFDSNARKLLSGLCRGSS